MITTSLEPTVSRVPAFGTAAVHLTLISMLAVMNVGAQVSEQSVLQVSAPLAGGVPGPAPEGPVSLTLQDAVVRGLEHNLAVVLGREQVRAAAGARDATRSRLYPQLGAYLADSRNIINLEAYGFPVPAGESPLIGPFDVFDARATVAMPLVDLSLWADARAASHAADAAGATLDDLRDQVVLAVSSLYLRASAAESRIDAARAQVATARALHEQAVDMKTAGVVAGIEVLQTEVQLAAERERLIVAENDAATTKLALARAIGLPLDAGLVLSGGLEYSPPPVIDLEEALHQAFGQRADFRSAQAAVAAADEAAAAACKSALPSLEMQANWGKIGPDISSALTTYTVAAMVSVPLYTGGAIHARKLTADAALADRQARLADLAAGIEFEVRSALLDLAASDERIRVARDAVRLAESQLEQARDRFAAGVADGVEVIQAQQAAATAHDNQIASLLAYNLARVRLARALGVAAEGLDRFLGGSR
jgi:outer membrane protein TolC